jgi:maltose alpha-D-glucosyltransferase/alpha-amylase
MSDWFKDAVIYEAHVRAFFDSNNDGIGDFPGLTSKLDYLQGLGINALWLLPFYPSPLRDDGYDIADYENIHPSYGTIQDFERFMDEAHKRDIRVITELVINHTSDQHPWFQAARRAPAGSPERDFYVWSETKQKYQGVRIIFTDSETSNWSWDDTAGAYYWHRFFHHQPDLNFDNPRVLDAVLKTMNFWLDRGVDGLRLDAVPYLIEREGTICENLEETHAILRQIRRAMDARYGDKMLIAEANQWPADVRPYFGDGDECHMAFHFPLMPRMFMALRQEDRHPITEILRQTPEIPEHCQWGLFLRNHDELTLEMVTAEERDYMYQSYAADPRMRINVGIRRRLAPLVENSRRRIELLNSLLFSLPGTPVIYYGDEIGMGDNIYLGDRNGVRTPMQWSPDRNGGFSRADPARLYAPLIMDPVYGYESVNVEAQSRSLSSQLNATKRLISVRKSTLAFGRGTMTFIRPANRSVLAYVRQYRDEVILCVANLSRAAQATELDLTPWKDRIPQEMLGRTRFPPIGELPYMITLGPYGFYWFQLTERDKSEPVVPRAVPEFETLVVPVNSNWVSLARERGVFERDVLPGFLSRTRWYPEHNPKHIQATLTSAVPFSEIGDNRPWIAFFETTQDEVTTRHVLPMQIEWVRFDRERFNPKALAAVRQGAREGTLLDVATDQIFIGLFLRGLSQNLVVDENSLRLEFKATSRFAEYTIKEPERIRAVEQSNSTALVDNQYVAKIHRQLESGINPEIEIGCYLTEVARFANAPALLGSVELIEGNSRSAVGVLHAFVENQGDGWAVTTGYLDRYIDEQRLGPVDEMPRVTQEQAPYLHFMAQTGRRLAELHVALAAAKPADLAPEPISPAHIKRWTSDLKTRAERVFDRLADSRDGLREGDRPLIDQLVAVRATLPDHINALLPSDIDGLNIRHHGDFRLGQTLIVKDDIFIIDFDGNPRLPLADKRRKLPAARDVAGLIRSIDLSVNAALNRAISGGSDEHGRLTAALDEWRERTTATFLSAYREAMTDRRLWPQQNHSADSMLRFFLLDQAFDEVEYELSHRPEGLNAPLTGLLRILSSAESEAHA